MPQGNLIPTAIPPLEIGEEHHFPVQQTAIVAPFSNVILDNFQVTTPGWYSIDVRCNNFWTGSTFISGVFGITTVNDPFGVSTWSPTQPGDRDSELYNETFFLPTNQTSDGGLALIYNIRAWIHAEQPIYLKVRNYSAISGTHTFRYTATFFRYR